MYVNDAFYQYIEVNAGTTSERALSLPQGNKNIKLVNEDIPSVLHYQYIRSNQPNSNISLRSKYYNTEKMLIIGDSITVGAWAKIGTTPHCSSLGWAGLLRRNNPQISFIIDAVSGQKVSTYNATKRANACTNIANIGIQKVWIALGTNGETNNDILKSEYSALIDALIVANPNITIYCQTPIVSFSEAVVELRRVAIREVVATKTNCIIVEGLDCMGDISKTMDGTHPDKDGHFEYYNNVQAIVI